MAAPRSQMAAWRFLGTADPCGRMPGCAAKAWCFAQGQQAWRAEQSPCQGGGRKMCGKAPLHQTRGFLHPGVPSRPVKAFVLNLSSSSWAKLLRITTLHMSCSIQEEQTCRIKGAPLWGEREQVEGWSANQLSGILAFSWWIRLCRCFVAWLTKRLIFFLYQIPQRYSYSTWFYQVFFFLILWKCNTEHWIKKRNHTHIWRLILYQVLFSFVQDFPSETMGYLYFALQGTCMCVLWFYMHL